VGALLRWAVVSSIPVGTFPWTVLMVNVAGSVLLGVVLAEEWNHPTKRLLLHDGGGIGFCGGLTTFSTFALEVVELGRGDEYAIATIYVVASVVGTIAGVIAGAGVLRRLRALTLPVEGET
jgi:CrcB protein